MVYDAETQDENKATEINDLFPFPPRWRRDGRLYISAPVKIKYYFQTLKWQLTLQTAANMN